jgi:putative sterol carrier protein
MGEIGRYSPKGWPKNGNRIRIAATRGERSGKMIDEAVKQDLNEKIQEGEFSASDIPAYLTLFCAMGNELEDLQEEVQDWSRRVQFILDGLGMFWIAVEDGRFTNGEGTADNPDLALTMSAADAALIFAGDKDAQGTFLSGALKVEGSLPDAIKMQTLIELVTWEIEY